MGEAAPVEVVGDDVQGAGHGAEQQHLRPTAARAAAAAALYRWVCNWAAAAQGHTEPAEVSMLPS